MLKRGFVKKIVHKYMLISSTYLHIIRGEPEALQKITPNQKVDNVLNIDFDYLIENGYYNYIFDIDNTLVPACHGIVSDEIIELFKNLKQEGCALCLISNNTNIIHVENIAKQIKVPYLTHANKPLDEAYEMALEMISGKECETVCVGDQMITDILGANNSGIYTILTEPFDPNFSLFVYLTTIPQLVTEKCYNHNSKVKKLNIEKSKVL